LVLKGIVEGFYGPPYRWSERFLLLEYFGEFGFNYYLYGPKEDPYHRKRWDRFYPPSLLKDFQRLHTEAKRQGITLNYALTPGDDLKRVVAKLGQLKKIGIEEFSLFFDDIEELPSIELAKNQAALANSVYKALRPRRLLFCPTQYSGKRSPYLEALSAYLDPEIMILWTGPEVVSRRIVVRDILPIHQLFPKRVILWDNYPVNDYDRSRIFLGPFRGREARILRYLSGYLANPMNQPRLSLIPLSTLASWLRGKGGYQPTKAIRLALKRFGLMKHYPLLRQFFPSKLYQRMSPETVLLLRRDWDRLIPRIRSWPSVDLWEGDWAVNNLLQARDLLIRYLDEKRVDGKELDRIVISRRGEGGLYFENQVYNFLLTVSDRGLR